MSTRTRTSDKWCFLGFDIDSPHVLLHLPFWFWDKEGQLLTRDSASHHTQLITTVCFGRAEIPLMSMYDATICTRNNRLLCYCPDYEYDTHVRPVLFII